MQLVELRERVTERVRVDERVIVGEMEWVGERLGQGDTLVVAKVEMVREGEGEGVADKHRVGELLNVGGGEATSTEALGDLLLLRVPEWLAVKVTRALLVEGASHAVGERERDVEVV